MSLAQTESIISGFQIGYQKEYQDEPSSLVCGLNQSGTGLLTDQSQQRSGLNRPVQQRKEISQIITGNKKKYS